MQINRKCGLACVNNLSARYTVMGFGPTTLVKMRKNY